MGKRLKLSHVELISVVSKGCKTARVIKSHFGVSVCGKTFEYNPATGFTITAKTISVHDGVPNIGSVAKAIEIAEGWVNTCKR